MRRLAGSATRAAMAVILVMAAASGAAASTGAEKDGGVIERLITIEGTIEKPRIIFIIPRAKVWREDMMMKSFTPDILRPVYPEPLTSGEASDGPRRR
jgi:hypothetical protein